MNASILIIIALVTFIVGGGIFVIWFVASDAKERRRHYKITLAVGAGGTLNVYRGKWTAMGREALTVVPGTDDMLADIDIRLSDGSVVVTDLRDRKVR